MSVIAKAFDYPNHHQVEKHSHQEAQLIYASSGVMKVTTRDGAWILPPLRGVWIPPKIDHEIKMTGKVTMRTLYISKEKLRNLPKHCCVIGITPLLRELILAAVDLSKQHQNNRAADRLISVLLDQIKMMKSLPLYLPIPKDKRLRTIVETLLKNPAEKRSLQTWATTVGASSRTLERLFLKETKITFRVWRQQMRLLRALELLAQHKSVTEVAFALGYDSSSAFITMFRHQLGQTPSRYFL